jgi:tetratricopeptide (TPR) repeat protein
MIKAVLICFFSLLFELPVLADDTLSSREKLIAELKSYIENNYMTPEDYIISKFKQHDVVFIGEMHRIKHDVELISNLIPLLYENGVYYLGTEFARRQDQPLIDSLLEGTSYDQNLAQQITFLQYCEWGFQEYVDIFKSAWQLNHNLPKNVPKFRILGLNDSPDWSYIKTQEDRDNPEIMEKVWRGGGEHLWARVILDSVIAKGEKIMVYSGIHHAFSEYKQPNYYQGSFIRFEDKRMGNYVFNEIGKRAITIYLHAPWDNAEGSDKPDVFAADGIIDELMSGMDAKFRRVGFDTKGTPFEKVTGETSIYKHGYANFTLATFCDGYVFQKPLLEYKGVTPIPNFINESNIEYARQQSDDPEFRNISIDDFNRSIASDAAIAPKLIHYLEARNAFLKGEYKKAIQLYLEALTLPTSDQAKAAIFHNVSNCYSLLGKAKKAFEYLDRSVKFGFSDYEHMEKDTHFDFLRKSDPERFKKIVARIKKIAEEKKSP